ncbi:hypothetical protein [Algoriphagus machipongonensis]|uniref:DUF1990 domain-containing protein n=1 Tax=Algoriphagus machipongonensis TaxID=388413 RepID=A3I228_9BACT|nr:hypothetical protein [Algoriphagus machipongonensis]EAZ79432.1 hypothetical protein ALPR1_04298 [Algoriphagus machipongonensis]
MSTSTPAQELEHSSAYSQMNSICYSESDPDYHVHFEKYEYDQSIDEVWKAYVEIDPERAWSGKMIHFNQLYSRETGEEVFPGEVYLDGMGVGQVIILNLHVFGGAIKLTVGHEVMDVDADKRLIRTCYLENSKSEGSQFIRFKTLANGKTEVSHKTFYRSGSWFRDKIIYPYFHTKAINEFHGNVRKAILENS